MCTECVQEKTRDVHFGARLEDDAQLALKIAKDVNARYGRVTEGEGCSRRAGLESVYEGRYWGESWFRGGLDSTG